MRKNDMFAPVYNGFFERYPVERSTYTWIVGKIRESMIGIVLKDMGFKVKGHKVSENGLDILAEYKDGRILALEVLNERMSSFIDSKRAKSMKENLKGFRFKGILTSFEIKNKDTKRILKNIPKLHVGFQTLPSLFFDFYSNKKIAGIKLANERSLKLLKNRILSLLYKIKFFKPMYIKPNRYKVNHSIDTDQNNDKVLTKSMIQITLSKGVAIPLIKRN